MAEAGHKFLAKLGKKRLRPGGKLATDWLIEQGQFSSDKKVLEVACNMGTTTIELAKTYGCQITAVDLDKAALAQAKINGHKAGVGELVTFEQANAMKLPYDDNSFDIVINEAMLTMQTDKHKLEIMREAGVQIKVEKNRETTLIVNLKSQDKDTDFLHWRSLLWVYFLLP